MILKLSVQTLLLACAIVLTSCRTVVVHSEAEAYFLKHPEVRSKYVEMNPTSVALMKQHISSKARGNEKLIERMKDFAKGDASVLRELEQMKKMNDLIYMDDLAIVKELEKSQSNNRVGQIYFYEYRDEKRTESGYMLIKDGQIITKSGVLNGTSGSLN